MPLEVRAEIDDLYWHYTEALDEGPLEAWPELFIADGTYRLHPLAPMHFEGRAAMEAAVAELVAAGRPDGRKLRHVLGPLRIHAVDGGSGEWADVWHIRASVAVFETVPSAPTHVLAVGEYRDLVVRDISGVTDAELDLLRRVGDEVAGLPGDDGVPTAGFGPLRFAEKVVVTDSELAPTALVLPL